MATVHVAFRNLIDMGGSSVMSVPRVGADLTTGSTSAATSIASASGEVATITASGGNVYLGYGATPVATVGGGDLLIDGQTITIAGLPSGTKIAAINPAT